MDNRFDSLPTHANCTRGEYKLLEYLHGKVADYTVSENAIMSICFDRGVAPEMNVNDVDETAIHLCYADLLKYIYLQPGLTKSYSQTNGTWSHKEGSTQLSDSDKSKILQEMRRQYALGGETSSIPTSKPTIRMEAHGMVAFRKDRHCR